MLRLNDAEKEALGEIATERGLVSGKGVKPGEPNLSAAARALMAKADPRMKKAAAQ
jgi:hypothetical protein